MLIHDHERLLAFDRRFDGLPEIPHGGYVAGVVAAALGGDGAEVRLRKPAPVGRALRLEHRGDRVELRDGDVILAEGAAVVPSLDVPLPVTLAEAEAASRRYPGRYGHLFPHCFGCGPERRDGDGLRIFPGPVTGRRLVAAPWVPAAGAADEAGQVPVELVWAALDCPQLWSLIVHHPAASPERAVTAALAARLEEPVTAGEPHVVIAWPIRRDGRTWLAGAAVFGPDGELCAAGLQTAALVSWGVPLGRAHWHVNHQADDTRRKT